ncbi:hypothetical protein CB1_001226006 [Camelus ferus]|nr:hypothetical protein CB1_001226006 [Camelus ferus]
MVLLRGAWMRGAVPDPRPPTPDTHPYGSVFFYPHTGREGPGPSAQRRAEQSRRAERMPLGNELSFLLNVFRSGLSCADGTFTFPPTAH